MRNNPNRASIALFWATYRGRQARVRRRDGIVTIYGLVLVALLYFPVAGTGVVEALRYADAESLVNDWSGATSLAVALLVSVAVGFAAGSVRGPVVLHPFLASTLAGSGMKRRVSLRRPAWRAVVMIAAVSLTLTTGVMALLATAAWLAWSILGWWAIAGLAGGVLVAVSWLAGQAARGAWGWVPVVGVGLAAVLVGTAGLTAADARAEGPLALAPWFPVTLGALALVALCCVPLLLDALRQTEVVAQSQRWEGALSLARAGSVAQMGGALRPVPALGRRWNLVRGRLFGVAVVVSDLGAALRAPGRLVAGLVGLVASGWMLASALDSGGYVAMMWGAGAAIAGLAGMGPLCDGLRHGVDVVTSLRIYGRPDARVLGAHLLAPMLVASTTLAGVAVGMGASPASALVSAVLLGAALTLVRGYDAARGPLPLSLTMPIVTPAGDLSAMMIALWQLDAALIAVLAGAALAAMMGGGALGAAVVVLTLAGVIWGWRHRLRH